MQNSCWDCALEEADILMLMVLLLNHYTAVLWMLTANSYKDYQLIGANLLILVVSLLKRYTAVLWFCSLTCDVGGIGVETL